MILRDQWCSLTKQDFPSCALLVGHTHKVPQPSSAALWFLAGCLWISCVETCTNTEISSSAGSTPMKFIIKLILGEKKEKNKKIKEKKT